MWMMEHASNPFIHSANICNTASEPDSVPSTGRYGCGQNSHDDNNFEPRLLWRLCVTMEGRLIPGTEALASRPACHSSCSLI